MGKMKKLSVLFDEGVFFSAVVGILQAEVISFEDFEDSSGSTIGGG